jgi:hypothetical protein
MTTFPFVPSNVKAPTFQPALDGLTYTVSILFNVSGQRYYLNCKDITGNLIFMVPLVNTPNPMILESLIWDEVDEVVIATLTEPHEFDIGEIVNLSIIQAVPSGYNGAGMCMITSHTTFTYPMKQNPGLMEQAGVAQFLISMTKAYFNSTLIFRNMMFEVNP